MSLLGRRDVLGFGFALPFAVIATPVSAHHGFTGRYNASRPVYLEGKVARASFRRPHPVITLKVSPTLERPTALADTDELIERLVVRPEDRGATVEVEYPPVALFFDLVDRVRAGDVVATIALRNCMPPHQLRGQWIRLADGSTVLRRGRMQTAVDGCAAAG